MRHGGGHRCPAVKPKAPKTNRPQGSKIIGPHGPVGWRLAGGAGTQLAKCFAILGSLSLDGDARSYWARRWKRSVICVRAWVRARARVLACVLACPRVRTCAFLACACAPACMFARVCSGLRARACVRACARVGAGSLRVCACVRACVRACARARLRACSLCVRSRRRQGLARCAHPRGPRAPAGRGRRRGCVSHRVEPFIKQANTLNLFF